MVIVELLVQGFVSILVTYLAFTSILADGLLTLLPDTYGERSIIIDTPPVIDNQISGDESTVYETGGPIPKILLENTEYQEAAVGSSTFEEDLHDEVTEITVEEKIGASLVNIYCQYKAEGYIKTTTGTGFFIQKNGVVLTNAHVAQFLLLESASEKVKDAECVLRTGNPARDTYKAELLYISPIWVNENAKLMSKQHPQGTGERDYALLYVSESVRGDELPDSFPYLDIKTATVTRETRDTDVFTAGYPAEILFTAGADAKLSPKIAETSVEELYTFGSNYADLIEVSGSTVSEQGSSGGPIVTKEGDVIGMITTKGLSNTSETVTLRAITLSYIDRTIKEETGFTLVENMHGNLAFRGDVFKRVLAPFLSNLLVEEIGAGQ